MVKLGVGADPGLREEAGEWGAHGSGVQGSSWLCPLSLCDPGQGTWLPPRRPHHQDVNRRMPPPTPHGDGAGMEAALRSWTGLGHREGASQPRWTVEGASGKQYSPQRCLPLPCPQLSPGSEEDEAHEGCSRENLGRIQFSVGYNFQESTLTVKIMKAQELPAKDFSGTSDPFVKIYLLPDKKHKLETKVKRKNLNPHWNETFLFEGEAVPPLPPESPLPLGCPPHRPATHTHTQMTTCTNTLVQIHTRTGPGTRPSHPDAFHVWLG